MGSIISLCYAGRYGDALAGLALSGPAARPNAALCALIPLITSLLSGIYGRAGVSPLFRMLSFDQFNKQVGETTTDFDWLSRDKEEVQKYIDDEHCGHEMSVGFWSDFLGHLASQPNLSAMPDSFPVFVMLGENDPCHESLTAVAQINNAFKRANKQGPKVSIYGGARHEIFNETASTREEVTADLLRWLEQVLDGAGTPGTGTSARL